MDAMHSKNAPQTSYALYRRPLVSVGVLCGKKLFNHQGHKGHKGICLAGQTELNNGYRCASNKTLDPKIKTLRALRAFAVNFFTLS
jgi:hypothetical protein